MKKSYQAVFFFAKFLLAALLALGIVCVGMELYLRRVHYLEAQPAPYPCIRGDAILNHLFQERCTGIAKATALKTTKDVTVKTNSIGLRMDEIDPKAKKLAVLGDSYTEGFGLENKESFAVRLEQALVGLGEMNLQVINGGTLGFSPALYPLYYEAKIRPLKPAFVLLNLDFTDLTDTVFYSQQAEYGGDNQAIGFPGRDVFPQWMAAFIYSNHFAVLRFIHSEVNAWARYRRAKFGEQRMEALISEGAPVISREKLRQRNLEQCWKPYELTARYLRKLKDSIHADGAGFAIHMYVAGASVKPYPAAVQSLSFWQKYEQLTRKDFSWACGLDPNGIPIFRDLAKDWGVPFFDTSLVVVNHPRKEALFFDRDAHWTSEGVQVVVGALAKPVFRLLRSHKNVLITGDETPRPRL